MNINKIEKLFKEEIRKEHTYNGKRWRRSLSNQPGVYDVRLNFQQIMILHEAIQQKRGPNSVFWSTPVFSRKKWNTMAMEIYQDYTGRMEKREERRKIQKLKEGPDFKDGQWSAEICESNLNKIKEEEKTT